MRNAIRNTQYAGAQREALCVKRNASFRVLLPGFALVVLGMLACCCYTPTRVSYRGRTARSGSGREPVVRVRLTGVVSQARVSSDEKMVLVAGSRSREVKAGQAVELKLEKGLAVTVNGRLWHRVTDTLLCRTRSGAKVKVGARRYRGEVLAFITADGELAVVNVLGLEDYLCGVVPCEIGPIREETLEAVKAQAVAARSFTLTRMERRKGLGFQLYDTYLRDQEYRGVNSENELAGKAVRATRGEVLLYQGKPAEALYHANCGGQTATGSEPYQKSVRDTPGHRPGKAFCATGKHFSWSATFGRKEFEASLGKLVGVDRPVRVSSFRLEKERKSGRVSKLRFVTDKGEFKVAGSSFRMGLGLKSTLFDMAMRGNKVTFSGRGWGHGVGLCQEGAIEMSGRRYSYRQILQHYYSGVRLGRVY